KRAYDYVRPVTAVQFLFAGKKVRAWAGPYRGTRVIDGAAWEPYQPVTFVTPPFPEFTSGHSTFSAAASEILKSFTGSDAFGASATVRAGSATVEPGAVPAADVTLSCGRVSDDAARPGVSRRSGEPPLVAGGGGEALDRACGDGVHVDIEVAATTLVKATFDPSGETRGLLIPVADETNR